MADKKKIKTTRNKAAVKQPRKTTTKQKPGKTASSRKTPETARSKTGRSAKKPVKKSHPLWQTVKRWLLIAILFSTFLFVTYIGYLDYKVQESFNQQQWSLPAKIYAQPMTIKPGGLYSTNQVIDLLKELGYRRTEAIDAQGTYTQKNSELVINTRSFQFWDRFQPSQTITVRYSGSIIRSVKRTENKQQLAEYRMEPVVIGRFYPTLKEDRVLISLDDVPQSLIFGLLATEDRDFYQHHGLSFKAIGRAIVANTRSGGIVQGGSTITQQLVKNLYLTPERTWIRKANEAILALLLEYHYSKDEILESYLNEIYLGQDGAREIHGVGLASQFYFGKPLKELELHEIALLTGIIKGPSDYNPRRYMNRAMKRRNLVLNLMEGQEFISAKQRESAEKKPLDVIAAKRYSSSRYPAFMQYIQHELASEFDKESLTTAGLNIFTTLDLSVQNHLEQSIHHGLKTLEKRKKVNKLQTAAVVTDRQSGEIVGFAGGRDLRFAGFNRVLNAVRPIGSLVKPAVFLSALSLPDEYTLITLLKDQPIKLRGQNGKLWEPANYDRKAHGYTPFHEALTFSYNLATVDLGMQLGLGYVAKTLRQMSINRHIRLLPSLLLGSLELSPLEVTQMYQTIATQGFYTPLKSIRAVTANDGQLLYQKNMVMHQVLESAPTYLLNTNLQEVMQVGTGKSSSNYVPDSLMVAGKTGTTNDLRDSWFAGYSGDYLAVFWVGRDDNHSTRLTGSSGALQLWSRLMKRIARKPLELKPPESIGFTWIDTDNWLRTTDACENAVQYPFIKGSEPSQLSRCGQPVYRPFEPVEPIRSWFEELFR